MGSSQGSVLEQFSKPNLLGENPPGAKEGLESANTEVHLKQLTEEQRFTIMEYQQLLSDAEERAAQLLHKNQQLMGSLADVEERMSELITDNEQLKHQLAACPDLENLKQELQQRQSRIKELWKQNCDQVWETDLILWEKERELESLRKQLEARSVMVGLPAQPLTERSTGLCGTNADGSLPATTDLQRAALLQPVKTFPFVTSCVTLATTCLSTTSSQLPAGVISKQAVTSQSPGITSE